MKRWKQIVMAVAVIAGISVVALPGGNVSAINVLKDQCAVPANAASPVCVAQKDNATDMIKIVINTMLYILGILAVIMIVVSGIRYTTSAGDASRVKAAKDTLTYSIVGLVVAILAFTIVNFVISRFQ